MESSISILLPLFTILLTGLLVSELFKHFKLPFASAIILIGAVLGPHGLSYVALNEVITFFGFLGSAFLMFMAGLETDIPSLKQSSKQITLLTLINGFLPFLVGISIAIYFEYSWLTALLVGTIFLSSSVAIVFSVMQTANLKKEFSQTILSTTIIEDILSLLFFAMIVQSVAPITSIPLVLYFPVLLLSILVLKMMIPRLARTFIEEGGFLPIFAKDTHEDRMRFTLIVLIAVLLYFSFLGVHPILAAFFVGLLMSQEMVGEAIYKKFHTISYGLFVPVFFFIIGMELNFGVLLETGTANLLAISIVLGLILSKFISGYLGGRIIGISHFESCTFGIVTTTQLTTTLAVAYAAFSIELLDQRLMTSIIVLAIVTNLFVPLGLRIINRQ